MSSSSSSSTAAAKASTMQQQQQQHRDGDVLTPAMRDRQARGKNPYKDEEELGAEAGSSSSSDDEGCSMDIGRGLKVEEPFADRERKAYALFVLDSPEQLMMYAQSAHDSIPGQRRRFRAILAGFESLPAEGRKFAAPPRPDARPKARPRDESAGEWMG